MLELLKQLGTELTLYPGADENAIRRAQEEVGWVFPDEYAAFLRVTNGATGFLASGDYISLWPAEAIPEENRGYQFPLHFPEVVAFGSNGGGEAFVFRRSNGVIAITPFVGMCLEETLDIAPTLKEFLQRPRPASWS